MLEFECIACVLLNFFKANLLKQHNPTQQGQAMKDGKPAARLFKIRLHEKEEEEYMLPYKKNFNS